MLHRFACISALLALTVTAGCATGNWTAPPHGLPKETTSSYSEKTNVAVPDDVYQRVEPLLGSFGSPRPYKTGDVWRTVFIGRPDGSVSMLRIIDTKFEHEIIAIGFASRYTYTVNAVLTIGTKEIPLSAQGINTTAFSTIQKRWEAVYLAVVSMAQLVNESLRIEGLSTSALPRLPVSERMEELSRLLKKNLINQKEYDAKKQEIMNSL